MSFHLPDLLEELAGMLGRPGVFRREPWQAAGQAAWIPKGLRASLEKLGAMAQEDMSVAYTDHFLVSQQHPVLYLEASAHRTGWLRDPVLLAELELMYAALGFQVPEGRSPDHLATELEALAIGFRHFAALGEADPGPILLALNALLDQHLHPLLESLAAVAAQRPVHPVYAEILAAAKMAEELARSGLGCWTLTG